MRTMHPQIKQCIASTLVVAALASTISYLGFNNPVSAFTPYQGPAPQADTSLAPQVLNVTYTPAQARLIIQVSRPNEVSIFNPVHEPQMKRFRFLLTNVKIVNGPTIIPVAEDPNIKEIKLVQTYSQNIPMVEVSLGLNTDSPQLAFDTQKILSDGSFTVALRPTQPATVYAAVSPNQMMGAPTYLQYPGYPTTRPTMPTGIPAWQQPYNTVQPANIAINPAIGAGIPVVANNWSTVKDIAVTDHLVTIEGEQGPLQVERAFTLKAPDRYVVDITPAKLSTQLRNRLSLDDGNMHPNVSSVKTSQLDVDTVRVVMSFKSYPLVVNLTPINQGKSIKLSY